MSPRIMWREDIEIFLILATFIFLPDKQRCIQHLITVYTAKAYLFGVFSVQSLLLIWP